ncbi:MAG: hypothetical protein IKR05_11935 [Prevotella sp.]|nr:hypothetical protein [Prevotella sp.]
MPLTEITSNTYDGWGMLTQVTHSMIKGNEFEQNTKCHKSTRRASREREDRMLDGLRQRPTRKTCDGGPKGIKFSWNIWAQPWHV